MQPLPDISPAGPSLRGLAPDAAGLLFLGLALAFGFTLFAQMASQGRRVERDLFSTLVFVPRRADTSATQNSGRSERGVFPRIVARRGLLALAAVAMWGAAVDARAQSSVPSWLPDTGTLGRILAGRTELRPAILGLVGRGRTDVGRSTSLPDSSRTPGALNPAVTQETIGETICVRGWTRTVRPPWEFTSALKREQLRVGDGGGGRMADYEEDHLVPLELGGAPDDVRNLWPEPRVADDGWTADRKDELEYALNRLVCSGRMTLAEAQRAVLTDWTAAYKAILGPER